MDIYDERPREMTRYLQHNGWHFNKKACDWAVSLMRRQNPATGKRERVEPVTKEYVDALLSRYGVRLENNILYDYVYVANMCKADCYKSSVPDEEHMAKYVKDVIDDPDAYDGMVLNRWYADMTHSGQPVDWGELL